MENYRWILTLADEPDRDREPPCAARLANDLPRSLYPQTANLKARLHQQRPGLRPLLIVEPSEHRFVATRSRG